MFLKEGSWQFWELSCTPVRFFFVLGDFENYVELLFRSFFAPRSVPSDLVFVHFGNGGIC